LPENRPPTRLERIFNASLKGLLLLALVATLGGCSHKNSASHVELVTGSEVPTPGMTFELRFDSIMVKGDRVGLSPTNSPLIINPPIKGTFTWLSSRSGVFTPTQPLALDTKYELSLSPGLPCADGQPCDATLHWTIQTPPFEVIGAWPNHTDANSDAEPEIKVAFNADLQAADAAQYLYFSDAAGNRIPADVRQGILEDFWSYYESSSYQTWKHEAEAMNQPAGTDRTNLASQNATNEVPHLLIASPKEPLPVGNGWKLMIASGIPSADGSFHLREKSEVSIGDVTPFVVEAATAHNLINSGATLRFVFSKPVPRSLTNDFVKWIELSDTPTNLKAQVWGRNLALSGDFKSGTSETVTFRPGFPSTQPFTLQGSNVFELTIPHVSPRLYFSQLACDQLAGGNRTFPLLSVNVQQLRIRAKLMDPAAAIHALRGYGSYFASANDRHENLDWTEPYRAIDYNVLPGVTIFDKTNDLGADAAESDQGQKMNLDWDELLSGRRAGVVFLDARAVNNDQNPALGTQALIQLTDLGLVWMTSASGVDAYVFSHVTGRPVSGAKACLMTDENQTLAEAVTDANGRVHMPAATNANWLTAQSGDDFHAVQLDQNRIWQYQLDMPTTSPNEPEDLRRVMLFSDRDLYRPGESLHLEAIVRHWSDAGLNIPAGLKGTLKCTDARDKVFFETNAVFSSLGSWSTLVPLPEGSRGYYSAQLHLGTNDYSYGFQVRDFQPSAFEIMLPCKAAYTEGEPVELPLTARYLFGKSLSRAQVKWSLEADDMDFQSEKFQKFTFRRADFEARYGRGQSSLTLSGHDTLSGSSNLVIAPKLSCNPVAPQPRTVSVLAEVTDVNQQTLSRRVEFIYHSSDFYLGLRQAADGINSNTAPPLEIVAVSNDGKPWLQTVKAHLTLQRIDWEPVRVQGAGKTVRFRNEAVFTNIFEQDIEVEPVQPPGANDDEAKGNPITKLPLLPAGEYLVEVRAADNGGHDVISSLNFMVSAQAELGWNYRNNVDLTLKPSQKKYVPGDTAEILVEAPFSGTALVSVERDKVLRSFVTNLDGNAPSIRIPLEPSDVPNVFVSVALVRGSENSPHEIKEPEYRFGVCELPVSDPKSQLTVEVTPASTNNLPGQPVDATVQVTDATHQPVAGAEVVVYAVDDGILGMTGYQVPDLHSFFYAERSLGVLSSISLPNLMPEDPDDLRFDNKGYLGGGGGGRERVRKNFLACAFWNATLQSDAEGKVHVQFTAPDSLTRYRLFAVAHTADSHFGSGQSAFHVAKPLIIEPALPSIANITDHLIARGVVLNQTTNSGEVIVSLELDDKAEGTNHAATMTQHVAMPAHGSAVVEFLVNLTDTGESKWVWRAHFAEPTAVNFTDAVQSMIPVGHIAPMMGEVLLSRVTTSQTNLLALANPQLLAGRGTITISVANTRLNELGESAGQLLHYPYGCAEQTGSSLLPWILLRDAHGLLQNYVGSKTNDSARAIRAGVARLFSMQTHSGGLSYWPREKDPMLWASAYGGMVLALAQRHGITVPKEEFNSLLDYLSQQLRSSNDSPAELSDECLALYALALAGRAEPAFHEKLYTARGKLSAEDHALLALAIAESHGPVEMISDLLHDKSSALNQESHFGCAAREQAIRLLAWIHYQPEDKTVDALVDDLMRGQKDAHWETTQGNAWSLLALTEYAQRVESEQRPAAGEVQYAGQSISFHLDKSTNVFTQSFVITNLANANLSLTSASTNCLYTTITIEARPPEGPQPRQDRGISLQRRYDRLDDDNKPQDIAGVHVGDRVLVTLRLSVREAASYVVIDDALPSILEAVNAEFLTQEARSSELAENENWWASDFREIRKDRCLSFADWVEPGTYVLRYVARVRAAGTVIAPPAKAEEMYHPERCGFTESQTLVSEPLK